MAEQQVPKNVLKGAETEAEEKDGFNAAQELATGAKASAPTVAIEFDVDGDTKTMDVAEVPLGLSFRSTLPLVVTKVEPDGFAQKSGVQEGWRVKRVAGKSLEGLSYMAVMELCKRELSSLPQVEGKEYFQPGALVIEFGTPNGLKRLGFMMQPLDFTFDNKMPIGVKRVTGQAEALGVQAGWTLSAIGGKQLASLKYNEAIELLKLGMSALPSK